MSYRPFSQYLHVRTAYGASYAPDGRSLAFLTDITGVPQVWSVDASGGWPHQRTFATERVAGVLYAPTGDRLLYLMDTGGNERTQLYLLEDDGTRHTALTEAPDVIHHFGGWSPNGRHIVFDSNARDQASFDLYVLEPGQGAARRIYTSDGANYAGPWRPDGRAVVATHHFSLLHSQLLLVDVETGESRALTEAQPEAAYESPCWGPGGRSLFVLSDRERDTLALARIDPETAELTWLRTGAWEYAGLAASADGRRLALVENVDGFSVLHILEAESLETLATPTLPPGVILDMDWRPDGEQLALSISGGSHNPDIWVLDIGSGLIRQVTHSARGGIPQSSFVEPELIHFPSFDGRQIPAFFYQPRESAAELPVVVYVHGGPESQFVPSFSPTVQYLVHRGFAVLAPNVRGSTGYGKAYTHLDDVRLRMDSVADLAHAVAWLRADCPVVVSSVAVMGGSYGGFMTLAAITSYPELWSAAVCIVGIANFETFLENTGVWRRALREAEYGSLEHDREFLRQISPIHQVGRITAPLLVIHGANDPRVPVGEAEQIVAELRGRGRPVSYLRFEDEGHGLVKLPNRIRAYTEVASFLTEYLQPAGSA